MGIRVHFLSASRDAQRVQIDGHPKACDLAVGPVQKPEEITMMRESGILRSGMTAIAMALVLTTAGAAAAKGKESKGGKDAKMDPAARGGYIVSHSGCNDCHTPWVFSKEFNMPVPDMTRMLSGHPAGTPDSTTKINPKTDLALIQGTFTAFTLPFGIVYSANLTPDKETGLGNWTEEMFVKAIRTGQHLGAANGRPILPPMPWPELRSLTDEDLKAVFAFLKSIPAIHNPVSDPKVPPPVLEGIEKVRPKMIEMLDAAHAAAAAPPPAPAPAKK
jgi:hypothetical protein